MVIKPQLILEGNFLFELIHSSFVCVVQGSLLAIFLLVFHVVHFLSPPTSFAIIIKLLCLGMGPFF